MYFSPVAVDLHSCRTNCTFCCKYDSCANQYECLNTLPGSSKQMLSTF